MTSVPHIPEKVIGAITGRYRSPDTYDNLPAIIRASTDLLQDVFCPPEAAAQLRRLLREATDALRAVEAGQPARTSDSTPGTGPASR